MKVEVKEVEQLIRELSIEVPADTVNSKMEEKFRDVSRDVALKGFRKGKAPLHIIKSLYKDKVRREVAEEMVRTTYLDAIRDKTLKVASHPELTELDFLDDGTIRYTAKVEVFPEIDRVNYDNLELISHKIEVDDEEVDEVVDAFRMRHSDLRTVDRPAADGDIVIVDLDKIFDPGMVLKTDSFPDAQVDLSNKATVKELREQLPGLKAGDEKEIDVKYDDDYPDKTFAGAHVRYMCRVKAVKERVWPELNDAFARQTGQAETALELRMKIRDRLKAQKADDLNRAHRGQIINQMCEKNDVPIPRSLIEDYLDSVVEDFKKHDTDMDEADIRRSYEQIGVNTIRWNMLMYRLAEQEKIEVLPSDTENLVNRFAENYGMTIAQAKEALQGSTRTSDMRESLLEDKVIDFLAGRAKITNAGE